MEIDVNRYIKSLKNTTTFDQAGKVTKSLGLIFEAYLPGARTGSLCEISMDRTGDHKISAEVIGFKDKRAYLMPYDESAGVSGDALVRIVSMESSVRVSSALLGRVIDGRGNPIDGKGPIFLENEIATEKPLYSRIIDPLARTIIEEPLDLGVRSINTMLTCGRGQRMGIMAGSGVGKSVLLGMMARNTSADVNVIGLIGERGREVREFIERDLGEEGLKRSVVIVATSDTSALLRTRAAYLAACIAEYFRDDEEKDVLLMMDSVTRFAMAQREIGLSMGEPPASKGYTPSVFAALPKLLERSGTGKNGKSVTGLFTVLVDGDDMDEPIADAARSILDGHIVLSRKLAQQNHFPAIDILQSASRVMNSITSEDHQDWAGKIRDWMATYRQAEDLINIGAYSKGANPKIDLSVLMNERIQNFLKQKVHDRSTLEEGMGELHTLIRIAESQIQSKK